MNPVDDMPQFLNPSSKIEFAKDYRIDDVDSWKEPDALDVSIRVNDDANQSQSLPNQNGFYHVVFR